MPTIFNCFCCFHESDSNVDKTVDITKNESERTRSSRRSIQTDLIRLQIKNESSPRVGTHVEPERLRESSLSVSPRNSTTSAEIFNSNDGSRRNGESLSASLTFRHNSKNADDSYVSSDISDSSDARASPERPLNAAAILYASSTSSNFSIPPKHSVNHSVSNSVCDSETDLDRNSQNNLSNMTESRSYRDMFLNPMNKQKNHILFEAADEIAKNVDKLPPIEDPNIGREIPSVTAPTHTNVGLVKVDSSHTEKQYGSAPTLNRSASKSDVDNAEHHHSRVSSSQRLGGVIGSHRLKSSYESSSTQLTSISPYASQLGNYSEFAKLLERGIPVTKYSTKGKASERMFLVDLDDLTVYWTKSKTLSYNQGISVKKLYDTEPLPIQSIVSITLASKVTSEVVFPRKDLTRSIVMIFSSRILNITTESAKVAENVISTLLSLRGSSFQSEESEKKHKKKKSSFLAGKIPLKTTFSSG